MSGRFQRGGRGGRGGARGPPSGGRGGGRALQITSTEQKDQKDTKDIKELGPPKLYPDLDVDLKAKELTPRQIECANIRRRLMDTFRNSFYHMDGIEDTTLSSQAPSGQHLKQQLKETNWLLGVKRADDISEKLDLLDDPYNDILKLNYQSPRAQTGKRKKGRQVNEDNQPNKYIKSEEGIKLESQNDSLENRHTNQQSTTQTNDNDMVKKVQKNKDRSKQLYSLLVLDPYNFPQELFSSKEASKSQRQQNNFVKALVDQMQNTKRQEQGAEDLNLLLRQEQHVQQNAETRSALQEENKKVEDEDNIEEDLDEDQIQEDDDYYQNEAFDDDEGYDDDDGGGGGEDEAWF